MARQYTPKERDVKWEILFLLNIFSLEIGRPWAIHAEEEFCKSVELLYIYK